MADKETGEKNGRTHTAPTGAWVLIHQVVLPAGRRAPGVPSETQAVPLEMRVKGFLADGPASVGDWVTVTTLTGRRVTGTLLAATPAIPHTFGSPVPELIRIGSELRHFIRQTTDRAEGHDLPGGAGGGQDHG